MLPLFLAFNPVPHYGPVSAGDLTEFDYLELKEISRPRLH